MSILIKGAEMPKSCWDCELGSAQQLDGRPCPFYSTDFSEQKKYSDKRADGCPLVPVPPHGRLIDADEFFRALTMDDRFSILEAMYVQSILSDAPTIIPAEEGEA